MSNRELADLMLSLSQRMQDEFPLRSRVRLSERGRAANLVAKRHLDRRGTVTGYSAGSSPLVKWDGRKTASGYAPWFVERIPRHSRK